MAVMTCWATMLLCTASAAALNVAAPRRAKAKLAPQQYSVALVALGCPKNTVDAEVMLGDLQRSGLRIVKQPSEADVVIVNTCAFVEDAKSESIAAVVEAAALKEDRHVPVRGLFVTGCLAQRYAEELAVELPEVDAVVGFEHYNELPEQVLRVLSRSQSADDDDEFAIDDDDDEGTDFLQTVLVGSASVPFRAEDDRVSITPNHIAYLRVAEGCDHACSFCAVRVSGSSPRPHALRRRLVVCSRHSSRTLLTCRGARPAPTPHAADLPWMPCHTPPAPDPGLPRLLPFQAVRCRRGRGPAVGRGRMPRALPDRRGHQPVRLMRGSNPRQLTMLNGWCAAACTRMLLGC
jgi:hypothetical protein